MIIANGYGIKTHNGVEIEFLNHSAYHEQIRIRTKSQSILVNIMLDGNIIFDSPNPKAESASGDKP